MKVRKFMTAQVVPAKPTDTVEDVLRIMSEIDSGAVTVIEDDSVVGIITDRDIVIPVVAEQKVGFTPVSDVMTAGVESCLEDDEISGAARSSLKCGGLLFSTAMAISSDSSRWGISQSGISHSRGNLAAQLMTPSDLVLTLVHWRKLGGTVAW